LLLGFVSETTIIAAAEKYRWPKPAEKEIKVYIHE
jgi:hypothetical protein